MANNLKALRKARGLKQEELSSRLSCGQAQYSRIERGIAKIERHLPEIAAALGVDPAEITEYDDTPPTPVQNVLLPVYGLPRMGGEGFSFHAGLQSKVECPADLQNERDAYAVLVFGNEMAPRLQHGDLAFVNPNKPPKINGLCVCKSVDGNDTAGVVREYLKSNKKTHTVQTLEPLEEIDMPADETELHAITGAKFDA